jgi:hypothetical protein
MAAAPRPDTLSWRKICGWSAALALLVLVAAPFLDSRIMDFLDRRRFVADLRALGAGGNPVAPSLPKTTALPPEDLSFVLLEETYKEDSPHTVFYTWLGNGPLTDVELTVKVESGGVALKVRHSWPLWQSGETKTVELAAKAAWLLPVLSGTAVWKGQKSQLAAMRPTN